MQKITLLFLLLTINIAQAQSFLELCENETTNGTVVDFESFQGDLYATGFFNQICGASTSYISRWTGTTWIPTDIILTDPGHSLRQIGDFLYIARYEESVDSNWVYRFDGANLEKFGEGVYLSTASGFSELPNIYDVIEFNGDIIACGEFDRVGNQAISSIMRWNGNQWEDMAGGLTGNIANTAPVRFPHELLVHDGDLYVIGNFKNAGGIEVNGVAKWNGMEWAAMGAGFNSTAYGIGVFNNEIYVGGSFTMSGTTPMNRIAKWNGSDWEALDFGFTPTSVNDFIFVHTLTEIDNQLMIAGGLKQVEYADGTTETCGGIVAFDGNAVQTFNGGVPNNDIEAIIKTPDSDLLIGGGVFGSGYVGLLDETDGVGERASENGIFVYPNPTREEVFIESEKSILEVALIDASGRVLLLKNKGSLQKIALTGLDVGWYYLKITTNQSVYFEQLAVSN